MQTKNPREDEKSDLFDWFSPEEEPGPTPKKRSTGYSLFDLLPEDEDVPSTSVGFDKTPNSLPKPSPSSLEEHLVSQMKEEEPTSSLEAALQMAQKAQGQKFGGGGSPSMSGIKAAQEALNQAYTFQAAGTGEKALEQQARYRKQLEQDPVNQKIAADLSNQMKEINSQRREARKLSRDKETQADWLNALDRISQSLVQYAAARYGMEKGVNLAGLQKVDFSQWEKMKDRAYQNLRDDLMDLSKFEDRVLGETKQHKAEIGKQADTAFEAQQSAEKQERAGQIAKAQTGLDIAKFEFDAQEKASARAAAAADKERQYTLDLMKLGVDAYNKKVKQDLDQEKLNLSQEELERKQNLDADRQDARLQKAKQWAQEFDLKSKKTYSDMDIAEAKVLNDRNKTDITRLNLERMTAKDEASRINAENMFQLKVNDQIRLNARDESTRKIAESKIELLQANQALKVSANEAQRREAQQKLELAEKKLQLNQNRYKNQFAKPSEINAVRNNMTADLVKQEKHIDDNLKTSAQVLFGLKAKKIKGESLDKTEEKQIVAQLAALGVPPDTYVKQVGDWFGSGTHPEIDREKAYQQLEYEVKKLQAMQPVIRETRVQLAGLNDINAMQDLYTRNLSVSQARSASPAQKVSVQVTKDGQTEVHMVPVEAIPQMEADGFTVKRLD